MYTIALDIGGTKTTCSLFDDLGDLVDDYVFQIPSVTYQGVECVYMNCKYAVEHIIKHFCLDEREIRCMGVGAPGPLNVARGVIVHAPMMGWYDFPLIEMLKRDFSFQAFLENDANLGALAEQRIGLGRGKRFVAYMTVSTGIGGGLILDGMIFHGLHDGAGEFGHMTVSPDGLACPCGNTGCLEMYASGTAIARRLRNDRRTGMLSKGLQNLSASVDLSCTELFYAAVAGDEYAKMIFDDVGNWLGIGISNIFNLLDLDIMIIGGGVSKANEWFREKMYLAIENRCIQPFSRSQVVFSQINDRIVLYGAFHMAKERYQGD